MSVDRMIVDSKMRKQIETKRINCLIEFNWLNEYEILVRYPLMGRIYLNDFS